LRLMSAQDGRTVGAAERVVVRGRQEQVEVHVIEPRP
jgi:hypothetical protein